MNTVILIGRLTEDPKIEEVGKNHLAKASFTIAVYRTEDETDFIRCVALGGTAEFIENHDFEKGVRVGVQGAWQTGSYENKDGARVYTNECFVNRIEFADSKKEERKNKGRR